MFRYTVLYEEDGYEQYFECDSREEYEKFWSGFADNTFINIVSANLVEKNVGFVNLTNHTMTPEQIKKAKDGLGVDNFYNMSFPNVPADAQEKEVVEISEELVKEVEKIKNFHDLLYVMIQGEFGVTFETVTRLKEITDIIPVYATTERKALEEKLPDGSVKKSCVFKHVRFREY